ncbi:hypothetical protein [Levilactobacillus fujinensis]|uniref:Transposase n=1 Tax=Levilactobacillus fujinensis TaxID=2486024 RepID=A0ABW1TJA9_9LACO|nr:hypothetical protein [Levilactobacillus fujinensis]
MGAAQAVAPISGEEMSKWPNRKTDKADWRINRVNGAVKKLLDFRHFAVKF